MHVDESKARDLQDSLGEDASVCHHHAEVCVERPKRVQESFLTKAFGLKNGKTMFERDLFHRPRLGSLAAPATTIGLRDNTHHLMPRVVERLECRNGEFWGAEEDDSKGRSVRHHFPARASLRIFLTIKSRLMPRTRSRNSLPSR